AISLSILTGAALAAPVLWPQIEFYSNSLRTASFSPSSRLSYLAWIASFSAIFPWVLGTFRTLDLAKFLGNYALGFVIYIGSAAFILALLGAWKTGKMPVAQTGAKRTAIGLVLVYFLVCSTPLLPVLYTRMAPIAVIGLTVLAALGLKTLGERPFPKAGWAVAGGAVLLIIGFDVTAFSLLPRCMRHVQSFVATWDKTNPSFPETPALRSFQVENLPHEISVQNPETILAFVSLVALAIYLRQPRWKPFQQIALLTLNFLPLIFFFSRYVPVCPVSYWERLIAGGPEQRRVADALSPNYLRLLEKATNLNGMLFPNTRVPFQRVPTVPVYSPLHPPSFFRGPRALEPPPQPVADFAYSSEEPGSPTGEITRLTSGKN